jgi:CPA2 family monovalent cation:H+ antiporter-2
MAMTPSLSAVGDRMARRLTREPARPALAGRDEPLPGAGIAADFEGHVVIAGYGQAARGITAALQRAGIPQVITTLSPDGASEAHARSLPVLLGDPARIGTLQEAGVMRARAVVIPDDEPDDAARIVSVARALRDDIDIVVRTRYAADIPALTAAGASSVIAEEIEAGASLSAELLRDFGVLDPQVREHLAELRRTHYPGPAPPAPLVQLRRSRIVDTDHIVEVVLEGGCEHVDEIRPVVPSAPGCEECLRDGDSWVALRLCLTCGHVGCCDSSPNRHARHHSEHTSHHVIRSAQPGESWVYCVADELLLAEDSDPLQARDARS